MLWFVADHCLFERLLWNLHDDVVGLLSCWWHLNFSLFNPFLSLALGTTVGTRREESNVADFNCVAVPKLLGCSPLRTCFGVTSEPFRVTEGSLHYLLLVLHLVVDFFAFISSLLLIIWFSKTFGIIKTTRTPSCCKVLLLCFILFGRVSSRCLCRQELRRMRWLSRCA